MTNFGRDLRDGLVVGALIAAYWPGGSLQGANLQAVCCVSCVQDAVLRPEVAVVNKMAELSLTLSPNLGRHLAQAY